MHRKCYCCKDGNNIALYNGDTFTFPQTISFLACCKWFRWAPLLLDRTLQAKIFRDKNLKRYMMSAAAFLPLNPTGQILPQLCCQSQSTENRKRTDGDVWRGYSDKYDLYPSAGKDFKLHPIPEFSLWSPTQWGKSSVHLSGKRWRKYKNGTTQIFSKPIKYADRGWSLAYRENNGKSKLIPYLPGCMKTGQQGVPWNLPSPCCLGSIKANRLN